MIFLKKMKKVVVFAMILIFGVMFAGCTSASNISNINTKFTSLYFAIDFEQTQLDALDADQLVVLKNNVNNLAGDYVQGLKARYYKALDNFEISKKITSNEKIIYKNHLTPYLTWNGNVFLIELRFYSITASRIFIKSSDYSGAINEEGIFETKTTETFSKTFSKTPNNLISTSLESYFLEGIKSSCPSIIDADFYYMFLTENLKVHSANSNETVESLNGSLFCFYSNENFEEPEFVFYVVQPNVLIYYLLCLAITFVFLAIYSVVLYIIKCSKSKKQSN